MRPAGLMLGVAVVVGAWACGGTTARSADAGADGSSSGGSSGSSSGSGSSGGGRAPVNHRPDDAQCATSAPPGSCNFNNPGAPCHSDADCAEAGPSGRCVVANGPPTCFCTWDVCTGDSECKTGQTCACHGSPYTLGSGNACTPGNCRIDADCGAGGYCSPSAGPMSCGGLVGYYCHTAKDRCIDDADCASSSSGSMCIYSPTDGTWSCQPSGYCAG